MKRILIKELYNNMDDYINNNITVCGWVKTIRDSKKIGFISINDGSCFNNLQVIFEDEKLANFKDIIKINVGSSISVTGVLIKTPDAKQPFEINATSINVEGESTEDYPLQKKKHSLEFLRSIAHLRSRTNTFNAVFRVRSTAAMAINQFFYEKGFIYAHTPIITGSDCEGAGDMFRVTTLDAKNPPLLDGKVDYTKDFFALETSLTVSGQLEAEAMCMGLGNVYTFGPTFRAENSNTQRHAAEFWMVEPEIAFADLSDVMNLAEDMVKYVLDFVLENCKEEMTFLNDFYDKELIEKLTNIVKADFGKVTYNEAIDILSKVKNEFEYDVSWGCDLQTEHERYLSEVVFKGPVFVTDYPKEIKSFYMRLNDDNKTVAAMDLLVPSIGELIGGSQREERLDILTDRMIEKGLNTEEYQWYLDLRKYGGTKHGGFGLGFERLIMYITGISNIRDVLPFPRNVGSAKY
ncbi:MAG: asparagine--tRNA ligase [Oscillospiraceae bacterium]